VAGTAFPHNEGTVASAVMGWRARLSDLLAVGASSFDGTKGRPPSGNGASSFHLFWQHETRKWVAAEATIEVLEAPSVSELYFWAMQVNFHDGRRGTGGGHIGPQWISIHPGGTAINWGGYGADGQELEGSVSSLPSRAGNVNTRDFVWEAQRPYRLRVAFAGPTPVAGRSAWRGEVIDLVTGTVVHIRDLYAPGDRLDSAMVWSEVFAPCDAPPVTVRWSDLALIDDAGHRSAVVAASVNYQSRADGGCVTTDITVDDTPPAPGFIQRSGTMRGTAQGTVLRLR